jgi:hypothetical protein
MIGCEWDIDGVLIGFSGIWWDLMGLNNGLVGM